MTHVKGWKFHKVGNITVPKELFKSLVTAGMHSPPVHCFCDGCHTLLPYFEGNGRLISRQLPYEYKPISHGKSYEVDKHSGGW